MYQNLNKNCHWQCNITKVVKGQRCWEGTGQKERTELLGNQGPLPDALQVGRFDTEVQPRKSLFVRRPSQESESKSHFRLPRGKGVWDIYGTNRRASGLGKGDGRQGRGAVTDVLRRREGVPCLCIFISADLRDLRVESTGRSGDVCAGPVSASVVPTSRSRLALGGSWLRVPEEHAGRVKLGRYAIKERKKERKTPVEAKASLVSEGSLQAKGFEQAAPLSVLLPHKLRSSY